MALTHRLSFAEAACGCRVLLTALDGRKLLLTAGSGGGGRDGGMTIRPGSLYEMPGEGMPLRGPEAPAEFGALLVLFEVSFPAPEELPPSVIAALRRAHGGAGDKEDEEDEEDEEAQVEGGESWVSPLRYAAGDVGEELSAAAAVPLGSGAVELELRPADARQFGIQTERGGGGGGGSEWAL